MNAQQIEMVRSTFAKIRPHAAATAESFYERLFELDPSLRPMFKGDMVNQGRMLMTMLDAAVRGLSDIDAMLPAVRQLGVRHLKYEVRDEHYDTVGDALLWTLEQGLGRRFTPEVGEAWLAAYRVLVGAMQMGAFQARARAQNAALSGAMSDS
jgi:hemoglobin-like flavoprotein